MAGRAMPAFGNHTAAQPVSTLKYTELHTWNGELYDVCTMRGVC